jgi:choline dehydrogenase
MVLMHSGIGPADRLREAGVAPRHDLRGVGENLHDHPIVRMQFACTRGTGMFDQLRWDRAVRHVARTYLFGSGIGSAFPGQVGAYLRTRPELAAPDVQCHFIPAMFNKLHGFPFKTTAVDRPGLIASVNVARPESRGWLRLRSPDPREPPRIHANYLATETDRRTMRDGVKALRRLLRQPAIAPRIEDEFTPGAAVESDEAIDGWIRSAVDTVFHPVGTCRMGNDAMAVVDARLKLHGIDGLRVADASVMPSITASNTNAPTIMIAEKAADMIGEDAR